MYLRLKFRPKMEVQITIKDENRKCTYGYKQL